MYFFRKFEEIFRIRFHERIMLANLNFVNISAMQAASKNLMETVSEVYESPWPGHDMLYVQGLYRG